METSRAIFVPDLPQQLGETWQIHARNLAFTQSPKSPSGLLRGLDASSRWCILILSDNAASEGHSIIRGEFIAFVPTVDLMWEHIVAAMVDPNDSRPRRPHYAEFRSAVYETHFRDDLNSIGVRSRISIDFQIWEQTYFQLASLAKSVESAMIDRRG